MGLGPQIQLRQSQQLVMTPQLTQAIKLLTLTNLELESVIAEEGFDLEIGQRQQLDRLLQLRRHRQRLRLAQVEARTQRHRQRSPAPRITR